MPPPHFICTSLVPFSSTHMSAPLLISCWFSGRKRQTTEIFSLLSPFFGDDAVAGGDAVVSVSSPTPTMDSASSMNSSNSALFILIVALTIAHDTQRYYSMWRALSLLRFSDSRSTNLEHLAVLRRACPGPTPRAGRNEPGRSTPTRATGRNTRLSPSSLGKCSTTSSRVGCTHSFNPQKITSHIDF